MSPDEALHQVFALLAKRELAASTAAWRIAREAAAQAEGAPRLALHEAVAESLSALLTEIAEHGLRNQALWGIAPAQIDVQRMSDECAAAWSEVKRLRAAGVSSQALVGPYVGNWMDPIGSRAWLERMRLGVPYQQRPGWIRRVSKLLRGEADDEEE